MELLAVAGSWEANDCGSLQTAEGYDEDFCGMAPATDQATLSELITELTVAIRYGPDIKTDDPISWEHVRTALALAKTLRA